MPVRLLGERLVGGGLTLAHHQGQTWMIHGALPGETVKAVEIRRRAGIVECRAIDVLDDHHPARMAEPCPHSPKCGGCDWPHVQPVLGTRLKADVVAGAARAAPELARQLAAAPIRTSPLAYRLRARLHWQPAGRILGFYAPRTWEVMPIPSCRILSPRLMAALEPLAMALARTCPEAADLEWLESLDGAVAVAALRPARAGPTSIDHRWLPRPDQVAAALNGLHCLNRSGRLQRGWGATAVTMNLPRPLEVPIGAFFQGNRHLVPWLFARVAELVGDEPLPVWDLHAGVGFLAAAALQAADRQLTLVESFRPSALAAQKNLPGARVAVGQLAENLLASQRQLPKRALLLTDPPRAGMTAALRRRIAGWHPERIIMLGCDPATWSRDAAFLIGHGYRITHLELVDLFPSTHHVEVLAMLEAE